MSKEQEHGLEIFRSMMGIAALLDAASKLEDVGSAEATLALGNVGRELLQVLAQNADAEAYREIGQRVSGAGQRHTFAWDCVALRIGAVSAIARSASRAPTADERAMWEAAGMPAGMRL